MLSKAAYSDLAALRKNCQEQIEQRESGFVHELMMNHNRNIILLYGLVQLLTQRLKSGVGVGFFAGMRIDVDVEVSQKSLPGLFALAPGDAMVAVYGEQFQGPSGATVPGGREKGGKVRAQDRLETFSAPEQISLEHRAIPVCTEFALLAAALVVGVAPAMLVPAPLG